MKWYKYTHSDLKKNDLRLGMSGSAPSICTGLLWILHFEAALSNFAQMVADQWLWTHAMTKI